MLTADLKKTELFFSALLIVSATLSFPRRRESISTLAPSLLQRWIPAFAGKTFFDDLAETMNKAVFSSTLSQRIRFKANFRV